MHPALNKLVEANAQLEAAQTALSEAQEHRRQRALALSEIADEDERWQAALYAYREFGAGLSLALAEAATGLPGRRAQSVFLVRAGRRQNQPKGYGGGWSAPHEPLVEWPAPDELERAVIQTHIDHGKPYHLEQGLGWGKVSMTLEPAEARAFLREPTAALAEILKISREDFVEYLSSEGSVRCEGHTKKGDRCRTSVAGLSTQLGLKAWIDAKGRGGYCRRHGGDVG